MVASVPLHRYHDVVWPCSTGRASSPTTSSAAVAVIIHGSGLMHRPVSSTRTGFAAGLLTRFALGRITKNVSISVSYTIRRSLRPAGMRHRPAAKARNAGLPILRCSDAAGRDPPGSAAGRILHAGSPRRQGRVREDRGVQGPRERGDRHCGPPSPGGNRPEIGRALRGHEPGALRTTADPPGFGLSTDSASWPAGLRQAVPPPDSTTMPKSGAVHLSPARHRRNQMPVDGKIFVVLSKTSRVKDYNGVYLAIILALCIMTSAIALA